MARKSRKGYEVKDIDTEEKIYYAAAYARLSVENGEDGNSIITQIEMIKEYIDDHNGLVYAAAYSDNGYTGTNFERPAFMRLIEDIKKRKIDCIVVKDMSRFARNYIEAGYYVETVFPFLGVRLISINDNFDSNRRPDVNSLIFPVKNMINMMYAKDISKKVWTALQQKKKNGYCTGNTVPFGYILNSSTHRNEPDPENAFYVYMIFQWALAGISINEIRKRLDMLRVPAPRSRNSEADGKGGSAGSGKVNAGRGEADKAGTGWSHSTVSQMLRNRVYVGDTISNKTDKALHLGREKTVLKKDRWIITENTHPALVAGDDFERVQKLLKTDRSRVKKSRKRKKSNIFADAGFSAGDTIRFTDDTKCFADGTVICAECGRPMHYEKIYGSGSYACTNTDRKESCKNHRISEKLLKIIIINQIYISAPDLPDKENLLENSICKIKENIAALMKERDRLKKDEKMLYEKHAAGIYGPREYAEKKEIYVNEGNRIREGIACEKKRYGLFLCNQEILKNYMDELRTCAEKNAAKMKLGKEFAEKYISRIEVCKNKRIKVQFCFDDVIKQAEQGGTESDISPGEAQTDIGPGEAQTDTAMSGKEDAV